jgi:hypothetical protein
MPGKYIIWNKTIEHYFHETTNDGIKQMLWSLLFQSQIEIYKQLRDSRVVQNKKALHAWELYSAI